MKNFFRNQKKPRLLPTLMYVGIPIFRGLFFKCREKIYGNQFFEIGNIQIFEA